MNRFANVVTIYRLPTVGPWEETENPRNMDSEDVGKASKEKYDDGKLIRVKFDFFQQYLCFMNLKMCDEKKK